MDKIDGALQPGIIPAYAGQISYPFAFRIFARDHPRIRGTNVVEWILWKLLLGSSPHTRDKFELENVLKSASGIIPAYAGQIHIIT